MWIFARHLRASKIQNIWTSTGACTILYFYKVFVLIRYTLYGQIPKNKDTPKFHRCILSLYTGKMKFWLLYTPHYRYRDTLKAEHPDTVHLNYRGVQVLQNLISNEVDSAAKVRIIIFNQVFFWTNRNFVTFYQIAIFDNKKIFFDRNYDFCQKTFLTEITIFYQHYDFWQKNYFFGWNYDFWQENTFFEKITIFGQIFDQNVHFQQNYDQYEDIFLKNLLDKRCQKSRKYWRFDVAGGVVPVSGLAAERSIQTAI